MDAAAFFSPSYADARHRFLERAGAAGAVLEAENHPLTGVDGEALAIDSAWLGAADARAVLLLSSGCHGVEGYCGAGVQNAVLADAGLRQGAQDAGVALWLLHGLNPHGFSWGRRATEDNVDLNRNFVDFSRPLPPDRGYATLARWIVPATWPPPLLAQAALLGRALLPGGRRALQAAVSGGQYTHPDGLFYGGRAPCWSHTALRRLLQRHARRCARLGWIDLHSGLGPPGRAEPMLAAPADAATRARARAWWGDGLTSDEDGNSSSAPIDGLMWRAAVDEAPQAEYTGLVLEFGTRPMRQVLDALREEQWAHNQGAALDPARRGAARRRLRDAFFVDDAAWRRAVVGQGLDAVRRAVAGLAAG